MKNFYSYRNLNEEKTEWTREDTNILIGAVIVLPLIWVLLVILFSL